MLSCKTNNSTHNVFLHFFWIKWFEICSYQKSNTSDNPYVSLFHNNSKKFFKNLPLSVEILQRYQPDFTVLLCLKKSIRKISFWKDIFLLPVCPPPLTDFTQLNEKIIWIIEQIILTHLLKNQPHVIRKILFHRMRIANKSKVYLSYHYFFDLWSLSF